MSRVRTVSGFDRDWMTKVEAGKRFPCYSSKDVIEVGRKVSEPKMKVNSKRSLRTLGQLLTIKEVAVILKVTDRAVYEWVYEKRLRSTKAGRMIRIATVDLEDFISA